MALNRAAFIIRFCYDESANEAEVGWRLAWLRDQVLPRIAAQRTPCDTWLWIHPRHSYIPWALGVHGFTVSAPMGKSAIENRFPWSSVNGLPKYEVQLRLDSDDLISEHYATRALRELDKLPRSRSLIHFQPLKVDIETKATYWCAPGAGRGHYGPNKVSAFVALRQNVLRPDYEWVYTYGHTKLWRLAKPAKLIEHGYCWAACHKYNDSTEVYPHDEQIGWLNL